MEHAFKTHVYTPRNKKYQMQQSNRNKSNITHLNPSKIRELLNDDKSFNSIEKVKDKFAYKSQTQMHIIRQKRIVFAEWCCACN